MWLQSSKLLDIHFFLLSSSTISTFSAISAILYIFPQRFWDILFWFLVWQILLDTLFSSIFSSIYDYCYYYKHFYVGTLELSPDVTTLSRNPQLHHITMLHRSLWRTLTNLILCYDPIGLSRSFPLHDDVVFGHSFQQRLHWNWRWHCRDTNQPKSPKEWLNTFQTNSFKNNTFPGLKIFFLSERKENLDINSDLKTQGGYNTCLLIKANSKWSPLCDKINDKRDTHETCVFYTTGKWKLVKCVRSDSCSILQKMSWRHPIINSWTWTLFFILNPDRHFLCQEERHSLCHVQKGRKRGVCAHTHTHTSCFFLLTCK